MTGTTWAFVNSIHRQSRPPSVGLLVARRPAKYASRLSGNMKRQCTRFCRMRVVSVARSFSWPSRVAAAARRNKSAYSVATRLCERSRRASHSGTKMGDAGLEEMQKAPKKTSAVGESGAQSGAVGADLAPRADPRRRGVAWANARHPPEDYGDHRWSRSRLQLTLRRR